MSKVIAIYILKNCSFQNKLTEQMFDKKKVMCIEYANGTKNIINMLHKRDETSLFEKNLQLVIRAKKTKIKVIFKEEKTRWI